MKNIHLKTFQDCSSKLIGLPYKEYDCWDLVKRFYKLVFDEKIQLSIEYSELRKTVRGSREWAVESEKIVNDQIGNFKKVRNPKFGDICLLNIWGVSGHVGIYINEKQFLHTSESTGSMIDRLSRWETRLEGFYRWQELD